MFELLFKYPPAIFSKGKLALLSPWPVWLMFAPPDRRRSCPFLEYAAAAGLRLSSVRSTVIWLMQTALIAILLFMIWHPAISVARLRPQQNVVAVLVDHSRSMGIAESGKTRLTSAEELLNGQLLPDLNKKFQVRMYEFGRDASRVDQVRDLKADDNATRIGDSLKHIAAEAGARCLWAQSCS